MIEGVVNCVVRRGGGGRDGGEGGVKRGVKRGGG